MFELFGFEGCPKCAELKAYLAEHNLQPQWIAVPERADREVMYRKWGFPEGKGSMPQLFIDGVRIGSCDQVKAMDIEQIKALVEV